MAQAKACLQLHQPQPIYSPFTHVQGAYGAPTGAVGGAVDGRQSMLRATCRPLAASPMVFGGRARAPAALTGVV